MAAAIVGLAASVSALPSPLAESSHTENTTYTNPILPGWHSDPSCVLVPELDNTFFCVFSTFISFPAIPIYASKDLINWKHVSNVVTRLDQLPGLGTVGGQQGGVYAVTLRFHDNTFYAITTFFGPDSGGTIFFTATDPYDDASWSNPVLTDAGNYDPSLFWDVDGTPYIQTAAFGSYFAQSTIELTTGKTGEDVNLWNGTGDVYPEGPHLYLKDGFYYLLTAEGGTETGHKVVIARSEGIQDAPYTAYENNPILTNRGTDEYIQSVGHADFFQDANGNWWGVALVTRSGPEYQNWPMGRETVLFPMSWPEGE